ncbi:hypothetical protein BDD12DRAFT_801533 [Trichophaea hybrida]|nr:hypothetical protein BDD12DRAFT_801533 [Trichophaea hybrida]
MYLYNRMLLATKLGDAVIIFHSSPWIKSWTATTIAFFTGNRRHRLQLQEPAEVEEQILIALSELTRLMGRRFKNVAKRCFVIHETLKDKPGDIQETDIIELLDGIKNLKVQAVEDFHGNGALDQ